VTGCFFSGVLHAHLLGVCCRAFFCLGEQHDAADFQKRQRLTVSSSTEPFVLDGRFRSKPVAIDSVRTNAEDIMKKTRVPNPLRPLQAGQIWKIDALHVRIRAVGKLFVHYRHYKADATKGSSLSMSKRELEKFLSEHKAILAQE
jgi:hypothetical protein